jgi:S-DNA-T family DNA segregation ATPase FtsK/SpoIIIE
MSLITRFDADDPTAEDREQAEARKALLEDVLSSFGIQAKVHTYVRGPAVTRYEVEPVRGIRVSRIAGLAQDLAVAFGASPVRVEPIPNKPLIGIEVPNGEISTVGLRAILESDACRKNRSLLAVGIGKDISGTPIIADLGRMPHLLIAGATNAGKTICLHSIITSLLMRARPDQVRLIMIDPKRVELMLYDGIPHLLAPIVQTAPLAADLLRKVIREMEHRFDQFAMKGVVNITEYNELAAKPKDDDYEDEFEPLPYVVVVVDELADLMMQARAEFEFSICRLAQMARATGIHLVIATQRPSVNVLTGTIKANIPSRIALSTVNHHDSRTIIDQQGAERLLGRGDMLYHPADANQGRRVQGAFISRHDLELIVDHLRDQGEPEYQIIPEVSEELGGYGDESEPSDELYEKAVELVASAQEASVSMLQRRFKIGYARAGRLVDMMEERGVVGPSEGSKARKVLVPPGYRSRAASFPPDEPVTYDDLEDEVLDAPDEEDGVLVSHDGETP